MIILKDVYNQQIKEVNQNLRVEIAAEYDRNSDFKKGSYVTYNIIKFF